MSKRWEKKKKVVGVGVVGWCGCGKKVVRLSRGLEKKYLGMENYGDDSCNLNPSLQSGLNFY